MNTGFIIGIQRVPGRLWSFLQFPLTRFLLGVAVIAGWVAAVQIAVKQAGIPVDSPWHPILGLVMAAGVAAIYVAGVRVLERRRVSELTSADALRYLPRGMLVGAALFCITMLVLKLAGALQFTGVASFTVVLAPFAGSLFAAVFEEILIRGLLFRIMEESLGSWLALAISAAIFGLLHAFNHGATVISTAAIALEAGALLAAAYMCTRSLWFVIGLHFAWNFTEGGVFAASVSGGKAVGLIGVNFAGDPWLTGGAFGPEASLPAVLVCFSAAVAFMVLAARRDRVLAPAWRR